MIVSDELKIMPPLTATTLSLLSKLGLTDGKTIEERAFSVGVDEVLNLLKFSLVSRIPLTETLLKKSLGELNNEDYDQRSITKFNQGNFIRSQMVEASSEIYKRLSAKLIVSKTRKMVCYAEVCQDFVDLLFSFLTVPLGHVAKETKNHNAGGCIGNLYNSVQDPDVERSLNSNDRKAMLINPKLAPGFKLGNQLLGVEECKYQQKFYYLKDNSGRCLSPRINCGEKILPYSNSLEITPLRVLDPKSHYKDIATRSGGFVKGPAMFTVTDNLVITPVSPVSGLSVLSKWKVPFSDIEERVVHIGKEEGRPYFTCLLPIPRLTDFLSRGRRPKTEPMESNSIDFKYVVDNTNNRVAFFESDEKLVDVLFSFLTMPMGTIVRLTSNRSPWRSIGCMNNLYRSVEILDERYLRTEACKTMLLNPQNGAVAQCNNLKLAIDDGASLRYFLCELPRTCALSDYKLLSLYPDAICGCGRRMINPAKLIKKEKHTGVAFDDKKEGVFVKGPIALTISDELRVMTSSSSASLSLFSKLGIKDTSTIKEGTSSIGKFEALKLLKCLLVSKTPLTEALLDNNLVPGSNNMEEVEHDVSFRKNEVEEAATNDEEKIYVKLMVSKSKKVVCFAEASERFVDLLFSFLTVPLGFIAKEMQKYGSKGCINHLYDSIQDLDARQHLASTETTAMLVNPKLAPGLSYIGQLLNIEEYSQSWYLTDKLQLWDSKASTHGEKITYSALTLMDPKSNLKDKYSGGGFLKGPAMFTITDDLIITPSSSVTGLSALRNLEVPFSDIEERIVYVGKGEASRLLVASLVTEAAITNTFLLSETKPGF